jgi:hypothetical protein
MMAPQYPDIMGSVQPLEIDKVYRGLVSMEGPAPNQPYRVIRQSTREEWDALMRSYGYEPNPVIAKLPYFYEISTD